MLCSDWSIVPNCYFQWIFPFDILIFLIDFSLFKKIKQALSVAGKFYIELLQDELRYQDHIASGKLANSFKPKISERNGNLYLEIVSDSSYMWTVNDGLPDGVKWSTYETGYSDILEWAKGRGFTFENKGFQKSLSAADREYSQNLSLSLTPV